LVKGVRPRIPKHCNLDTDQNKHNKLITGYVTHSKQQLNHQITITEKHAMP
jgi:hypothetical protein